MSRRALTALLIFALFSLGAARAATILVPDDYTSIQEAIDAAVVGDSIAVFQNVYTEDLSILTDSLELFAVAGDTVTIKGVTTLAWSNWPLADPNIDIQADGVKLHGFNIASPDVADPDYSSGIVIAGAGVEIYENVFTAIGVGGGGCVMVQTYRDTILGYPADVSFLAVHDNSFGGAPGGGYVGVFINHTLSAIDPVTIADNSFAGNIAQGIVSERDNTLIQDNILTGDPVAGSLGMILMDWDSRPQTAVSVSGNELSGFDIGIRVGTSAGQPLSAFTLQNNLLQSNALGVEVRASADGVSLHGNSIAGSATFAVQNADTTLLDASGNWLGDNSPAGVTAALDGDVDYSPWLGDGTDQSADPGFQGDLALLHVDDDSPVAGLLGHVAEGIDLVSGSTVVVEAGSYTEDLVIDKDDLELRPAAGAAATLKGDSTLAWPQWPLVAANIDVLADGVSIHGFSIESPAVQNNHYSSGIVVAGANVEIYDNDFLGLASGDGGNVFVQSYRDTILGYAVDVSGLHVHDNTMSGTPGGGYVGVFINHTLAGGGDVTIADNDLSGSVLQGIVSERDNTLISGNALSTDQSVGSRGIMVMDWDARAQDAVSLSGNSLTGFEIGTRIGWVGQPLSNISVSGDTLTANATGLQVRASAGGVAVHGCWIAGNTTYGAENTDTGTNLDATGNWWGDVTGPYHATANELGEGDAVSDWVLFDPWEGMSALDITPALGGLVNCENFVTLTFAFAPHDSTPALRGYEITFTADSLLGFDVNDVQDSGELSAYGPTGFEVVDNEDGTITVTDGIFGDTSGVTSPLNCFTVDFHGVSEGLGHASIVDYKLRDLDNGFIYADPSGAEVEVDCTEPGLVSAVAAGPRHQGANVTWTDPGDVDLDSLEIWRGLWHDGNGNSVYPEYDDSTGNTIPTRPLDRADALASSEWERAGAAVAGAETFTDSVVERGVYYYEVFAMDQARNFGPPAAENRRASNYWLGDVDDDGSGDGFYDGLVNATDVTAMGAAFGTNPGDGQWNGEADVGPTSDWSRFGIPLTDDVIDFEDLMVFAMNYGFVAPLSGPPADDGLERAQDAIALLEWRLQGAGLWVLSLLEPCPGIQGLRLQAALPKGVSAQVAPGSLLGEQSAPAFLQNIARNGLDAGLALVRSGAEIQGAGELLRVTLSADADLSEAGFVLRGVDNGALDFEFLTTDVPTLPTHYRVEQNFPNPFNPETSISFALPAAQTVRLAIFDLAGRRVATLVDEALSAGQHSVSWNGRHDNGAPAASGLYFYRIEAGPLVESRKMLLVK